MNKTITSKSIAGIKNQLVDTILIAGTSVGLLVLISSLFPFDKGLLNVDFYVDILGLSLLYLTYFLRNKLSLVFKSNVIIAMLFVLFISDVLENGLDTPDFAIIILIPFLTTLIYRYTISLLTYILAISIYLTIGYLFHIGAISSPYYDSSGVSYIRWIEVVLILTVVSIMISLFLNKFDATINQLLSDQDKKNKELSEREYLLATITKNIPRTFLTVIDKDLNITYTDGGEYEAFGLDPKSFYNQPALKSFEPLGEAVLLQMENAYKATFAGVPQNVELVVSGQNLIYKMLPLTSDNDEVKSILVVAENITEEVATKKLIEDNLEEKSVLLQEIHHRVKNNLAVVSGLLELQSYNIEDDKTKLILRKSTNRILSIAKVHEMLYESKNFTKIPFKRYIKELTEIIIDSLNIDGSDISISTNISVQHVNINHGVPLGIIFNELITNSIKYGFNGKNDKIIEIYVDKSEDLYTVIYRDNGIGIENFEAATSKSLGFTLIHSLLDQIEAEYQYDTDNKFELTFRFSPHIATDSSIK
jgi:two-component sensor histidine kinase